MHRLEMSDTELTLSALDNGVPPVFRSHAAAGGTPPATAVVIQITRLNDVRQVLTTADRGGWWEAPAPSQSRTSSRPRFGSATKP